MGKKILIDMAARGRNGGKARAANMSDMERSEAARKAVNSRWAKKRAADAAAKRRGRKSAGKKRAA